MEAKHGMERGEIPYLSLVLENEKPCRPHFKWMLIAKALPWILHQERTCDSASYMIIRSVHLFFKLHKKVSLFTRYKFMRATGAGGETAQLLEHLLFLQRTRAQFPTLRRLRMAPDSSSGESNALFWHRRSLKACVNTCTQTHMLIYKIKTNLQNVSNRFSCWTLMPPVSNWYQEEWEITHKSLKKIKVLYQNQRVQ